ncbi:MAG: metallophosphatase family protein [Prevotellaceae bacterium]|jgi:putative phosphoesterase|nr:metallophosphatase family protein [Prevotellaceae bacterium]
MVKIGLLSDTHGYFDDKLKYFFEDVDEIWHAGDIGSLALADTISRFKPLRAVYGNIDGTDVRTLYPEFLRFTCEEVDTLITHIGGYPNKYEPKISDLLIKNPPALLISGHSHILKVIYDKHFSLLFVNSGAAGKYGFHTVRTAIRFSIDNTEITNMEIGEWKK